MTDQTQPDSVSVTVALTIGGTTVEAGPIEAVQMGRGAWVIRLPVLVIESVQVAEPTPAQTTPTPTPAPSTSTSSATVSATLPKAL